MVRHCRLCEKEIPEENIDNLCDRCWELQTRIERDPKIAANILVDLGYTIRPDYLKD